MLLDATPTDSQRGYDHAMEIPFSLRGFDGTVVVELRPNDDPATLGCAFPAYAQGLPVCTAVIKYAGQGYDAVLGWVQLVSSTDGESGEAGFDPDPLGFYEDLATPYCWLGIRPTLFDAPSRDHRQDMVWVAHSFLCFSPTLGTREVRAVLGFSWGFDIRVGHVRLRPVQTLAPRSWDGHIARLSAAYPTWRFSQGFHTR
jgi:hypothetical protein